MHPETLPPTPPALAGRLRGPLLLACLFTSLPQPLARAQAAAERPATAQSADPREADVRKLIDRYFRSWSAQDIDHYGQCFMPQAVVQFIDPKGALASLPLAPFLKSQRDAQRQATKPMTETAEKVDVRFEGDVARVVVYWKLIGDKTEYGYDHYTIIQSEGRWRIANLLFYGVTLTSGGDGR